MFCDLGGAVVSRQDLCDILDGIARNTPMLSELHARDTEHTALVHRQRHAIVLKMALCCGRAQAGRVLDSVR